MRLTQGWAVIVVIIVIGVIGGSVSGGCRKTESTAATAAALRQILDGKPVMPAQASVWADVREFYMGRDGAPAWVEHTYTAKATDALQLLRTAWQDGFTPADYGEQPVRQLLDALEQSHTAAAGRARLLAEFDVRITTGLLALGRDVALGRTAPTRIDRRWKARRRTPNFAAMLSGAIDADVKEWLEMVRPRDPEYGALQHALIDLHGQLGHGGWPRVAARALTVGQSDPSVITLRQRLRSAGLLSGAASADASPVYDAGVEAGVRAFQDLHALKPSGIADAQTLAAMNVPIEDRIKQLQLNLERWRWMPDELGPRHLMVNIPYFHLIARENGKSVKEIRVIVGKPDPAHETPVFSSELTTVVFSPYWNIPDTIAEGETLPAVARDPAYLTRNNIEILRRSGAGATRVDPSSVNWNDQDELRQLAFRQRPGSRNALGRVKFLFPSAFDVYLHDTPSDSLFARVGRAFSHGCVRLEEPEALAKYVLADNADWDEARIAQAMQAGVERPVKLHDTLPVHIAYFTVWVDDRRGLHFLPDVYGYDRQQAAERSGTGRSSKAN
jgi:murein L,D-transpeptidase YcbB/YkuD